MKKLLLYLSIFAPLIGFSQEPLVINGAASSIFIVEYNGTKATPIYIDIGDSLTSGISVNETKPAWIISEAEFNMVKWDIGPEIGTFMVPFGDTTYYYLPDSLNFTTLGSSGGSIKFSTWHTDNDNGVGSIAPFNVAPYNIYPDVVPSDVTNMASALNGGNPKNSDNSYNVVDRFWIVDADSYGTKPTPGVPNGLTFTYIRNNKYAWPYNWEIKGSNGFVETNLIAQRFNPAAGKGWGDFFGPGGYIATNANTGRGCTGPITTANFYRSWTLSNSVNPLPITLVPGSFTAQCIGGMANIQWTSATEINNASYTVKKTSDGVKFFPVETVLGQGNKSTPTNYSVTDSNPLPGTSYYYLFQTDFDFTTRQVYPVIPFNGCDVTANTVNAYNTDSYLDVQINALESDNYQISLTNLLGQSVIQENKAVTTGYNEFKLSNTFSPGVYLLNVRSNSQNFTKKIVIGLK